MYLFIFLDLIRERAADRAKQLAIAKTNRRLLECEICFKDDCLSNEITHCDGNPVHQFCQDCAKKHAMERIGQGNEMHLL